MQIRSTLHWMHWLALAGAWLALAAPAQAAPAVAIRAGDASFAPEAAVPGGELALRSAGVMRWFFIEAYAAALYLDEQTPATAALRDVPKRLEIEYFRGFEGPDFGRAADAILARSFAPETLAPLRGRIDRMSDLYENVEAGDRYTLTYLPGIGTELAKNGEPRGVIEGADFAAAYFAIWLGDAPADEDLRDRLLGRD